VGANASTFNPSLVLVTAAATQRKLVVATLNLLGVLLVKR
jgi:hypothetical protein